MANTKKGEERYLELADAVLSCALCGHFERKMVVVPVEELPPPLRQGVVGTWRNLWYHTGGTTYPHVAFVHEDCLAAEKAAEVLAG